MTLQKLLEILQKLSGDAEVTVLDTNGNETADILIINHLGKKVEITGIPEPKRKVKLEFQSVTWRYE